MHLFLGVIPDVAGQKVPLGDVVGVGQAPGMDVHVVQREGVGAVRPVRRSNDEEQRSLVRRHVLPPPARKMKL